MAECRHNPPCPIGTPTWQCGQRTWFERSVRDGLLPRSQVAHLLQLWGVPMSPESATARHQRLEREHEAAKNKRLW